MARVFLSAEWRHLAMLNYVIDPEVLAPLVPPGTELDAWEGRCYVSMVGFLFRNTRVFGVPVPFHRHFEEINLRFYVRHQAQDGWRRGVVFVKEIVPRRAVAAIARWVYNENYVACPTWSRIDLPEHGGAGRVEYGWRSGRREHRLEVRFQGEAHHPQPGSQAEFITEHYWGYVLGRDGSCVEYEVSHPPWRVWAGSGSRFDCDVPAFYGVQYCEAFAGQPTSAFVAEGSPVFVHRGRRIPR